MSREIKFRAWDKKQERMLYGASIGTIKVRDENAPLIGHEFSYSEDCIFEQYTGLKDKNGKEIYEGDIMSSGDIVRFSNDEQEIGSCGCCVPEFCGSGFIITTGGDYPSKCEVIGNIHENPELVGGEE